MTFPKLQKKSQVENSIPSCGKCLDDEKCCCFFFSTRVESLAALLVYQMHYTTCWLCRCGLDLFRCKHSNCDFLFHMSEFFFQHDLPFLYPCLSKHLHVLESIIEALFNSRSDFMFGRLSWLSLRWSRLRLIGWTAPLKYQLSNKCSWGDRTIGGATCNVKCAHSKSLRKMRKMGRFPNFQGQRVQGHFIFLTLALGMWWHVAKVLLEDGWESQAKFCLISFLRSSPEKTGNNWANDNFWLMKYRLVQKNLKRLCNFLSGRAVWRMFRDAKKQWKQQKERFQIARHDNFTQILARVAGASFPGWHQFPFRGGEKHQRKMASRLAVLWGAKEMKSRSRRCGDEWFDNMNKRFGLFAAYDFFLNGLV